jgi:hypothetical protein
MKKFLGTIIFLILIVASIPAIAQDIEIVPFEKPTLKKYPDIPKIQNLVEPLYKNLLVIRKQPQFVKYGFGAGFPEASKWLQACKALEGEVKGLNVPDGMKDVGQNLILLGQTYFDARKNGFKNLHDLEFFEDQVYDLRTKVAEIIYIDVEGLGCE